MVITPGMMVAAGDIVADDPVEGFSSVELQDLGLEVSSLAGLCIVAVVFRLPAVIVCCNASALLARLMLGRTCAI